MILQNHRIICLLTGQFVLVGLFASVATNQGFLSFTIFLLYLTTMLYWGPFNVYPTMKFIDMVTVLGNIGAITWYNSYWFCCGYRDVWIKSILTSMCVYVLNEIIIYIKTHEHSAVPLRILFTEPGSKERNKAWKINLFIHGTFLHILPATTFAYCALSSKIITNWYQIS